MKSVPAGGKTMGEIVMRGYLVMEGYLKNPKATKEAFANGWFHSGDLSAKNPDGYVEIKEDQRTSSISMKVRTLVVWRWKMYCTRTKLYMRYQWWLGQMSAGASHQAQMPAYWVLKSSVWTPAKNSDGEDSESSQGQGKRNVTNQLARKL